MIKYKQKKFARGHTKRSQRTKDRVVKRYLKSEATQQRSTVFWGEVARVQALRKARMGTA